MKVFDKDSRACSTYRDCLSCAQREGGCAEMLASSGKNLTTTGTCGTLVGQAVPILPLARYRLQFSARRPIRLPRFSGSAWRGAFGGALKRAVCVTGRSHCEGCLLDGTCVYPYLFETRPPPDAAKMRRYRSVPRPFTLEEPPAGEAAAESTSVHLGVTLFGRANRLLPYIVHALRQAAALGIGGTRNILALEAVVQESAPGSDQWPVIGGPGTDVAPLPPRTPAVPENPGLVTVSFRTPIRLKRQGRNVTPESFEPADLLGNLVRRLSMLTYFHTDTPLETDFAGLARLARTARIVARDLVWRDWTRYSSRQQTGMQMGGITGRPRWT